MSQFKDVGHAMLIRNGLIKKLDTKPDDLAEDAQLERKPEQSRINRTCRGRA
jgi:hypothetical protein